MEENTSTDQVVLDKSEDKSGVEKKKMAENDSDDDSWEDAESEDETGKLQIDELEKSRKESKNMIDIPDNILEECKKLAKLDHSLNLKAKKRQLNAKHIKTMIRQIISTKEFIVLLRQAGLATVPEREKEQPMPEPPQPKMTRSMAKTLTESGDMPWIVEPATPAKEPPPEIVSLVTEEFPEDEDEDPEYRPELDRPSSRVRGSDDDDSSFMMSETSEYGTPRTNRTDETNTPRSNRTDNSINTPYSGGSTPVSSSRFGEGGRKSASGTPRLQGYGGGGLRRVVSMQQHALGHCSTPGGHSASRILDFDADISQLREGYSTRSKRPMTEVDIDDLEQMFIPFDVTPDMYERTCDNEDYAEFLKTLYAGTSRENTSIEDDPVADPEYRFQPDEEDLQLRDPEELRNDRATKISRREVADLMAELLECANKDMEDNEKRKRQEAASAKQPKNRKRKHGQMPGSPAPPANSYRFIHTPPPSTSKMPPDDRTSQSQDSNQFVKPLTAQEAKLANLQSSSHGKGSAEGQSVMRDFDSNLDSTKRKKGKTINEDQETKRRSSLNGQPEPGALPPPIIIQPLEPIPVKEDWSFQHEQIQELSMQIQQHIQLTTQLFVMSSHNHTLKSTNEGCVQILQEVNKSPALTKYSGYFGGRSNLQSSLQLVDRWSHQGENPNMITKKVRERDSYVRIKPSVLQLFLNVENVFYFPQLLPTSGLKVWKQRCVWLQSEDQLMAVGLQQIHAKIGKRFATRKDLASTLSSKYLPVKKPSAVMYRFKEMMSNAKEYTKGGLNPVKYYYQCGRPPMVEKIVNSPLAGSLSSVRKMIECGVRDDIPAIYLQEALEKSKNHKKTKRNWKRKCLKTAADPVTVDELNDGDDEKDEISSDSDSTENESSRHHQTAKRIRKKAPTVVHNTSSVEQHSQSDGPAHGPDHQPERKSQLCQRIDDQLAQPRAPNVDDKDGDHRLPGSQSSTMEVNNLQQQKGQQDETRKLEAVSTCPEERNVSTAYTSSKKIIESVVLKTCHLQAMRSTNDTLWSSPALVPLDGNNGTPVCSSSDSENAGNPGSRRVRFAGQPNQEDNTGTNTGEPEPSNEAPPEASSSSSIAEDERIEAANASEVEPPVHSSVPSSSSQQPDERIDPAPSGLKSLSSNFSRSPLKAASDRIVRKYATSPLKIQRKGGQYRCRTGHSPAKPTSLGRRKNRRKNDDYSGMPSSPTRRDSLTGADQKRSTRRRLDPGGGAAAAEDSGANSDIDLAVPGPSGGSASIQSGRQFADLASAQNPGQQRSSYVHGDARVQAMADNVQRLERQARETQVTLTMIKDWETRHEREARETRESMELFAQIQEVIEDSTEKKEEFKKIMAQAETLGAHQTFLNLRNLVAGFPKVEELMFDLIPPEEANELELDDFIAYTFRQRLKAFVIKLSITMKGHLSNLDQVLKALHSLSIKTPLNQEALKKIGMNLFKDNKLLLNEFLMLIPILEPMESPMPSPELEELPSDSDSNHEVADVDQLPSSPDDADVDQLPSSPEVERAYGSALSQEDVDVEQLPSSPEVERAYRSALSSRFETGGGIHSSQDHVDHQDGSNLDAGQASDNKETEGSRPFVSQEDAVMSNVRLQSPTISSPPPRSHPPYEHMTQSSPPALKSPLKSLTSNYSRSPLKAASDRILRKYSTSPLKNQRPVRKKFRPRVVYSPAKPAVVKRQKRKARGEDGGVKTSAVSAKRKPENESDKKQKTRRRLVSSDAADDVVGADSDADPAAPGGKATTPHRRKIFDAYTGSNSGNKKSSSTAAASGSATQTTTPKRLRYGDSPRGQQASPRVPGDPEEHDTPSTGASKRLARQQKELQVTLAMLGPLETKEERDARETRESEEMFAQIQQIIKGSKEKKDEYKRIMSKAKSQSTIRTFVELRNLTHGYPDVQELLLDLLTPEESFQLGSDIYGDHCYRQRKKRFVLKMKIAFKERPTYYAKVLKEFDTLSKEPTLKAEVLKKLGIKLFKSNQHLLDEFLMLIPGIEPPASAIPSPEIVDSPPDSDSSYEDIDVERATLPRSPKEDKPAGPVLRFCKGGVYIQEGKTMRLAVIERSPPKDVK